MRCPNCQMEVDPSRGACGYCGTPVYPAPAYGQYPQPAPGYYPPPVYGGPVPYYGVPAPVVGYYAPPQKTLTPIAAGILLLIGGVLALINGALIAAAGAEASSIVPGIEEMLFACAALEIVFSILTVVGGICAVQRKVWGLALVGSIFGMLSIGPLFLSSIFGLIGLILVAVTKQEFD